MCFKRKPKKICDLCLYRESCMRTVSGRAYCDQFCHKKQGARVICLTCLNKDTCKFNRYAGCLYCKFYREN